MMVHLLSEYENTLHDNDGRSAKYLFLASQTFSPIYSSCFGFFSINKLVLIVQYLCLI